MDIHCTFCAIKKIRNQVSTSVETVLMFVTKKNQGEKLYMHDIIEHNVSVIACIDTN